MSIQACKTTVQRLNIMEGYRIYESEGPNDTLRLLADLTRCVGCVGVLYCGDVQ